MAFGRPEVYNIEMADFSGLTYSIIKRVFRQWKETQPTSNQRANCDGKKVLTDWNFRTLPRQVLTDRFAAKGSIAEKHQCWDTHLDSWANFAEGNGGKIDILAISDISGRYCCQRGFKLMRTSSTDLFIQSNGILNRDYECCNGTKLLNFAIPYGSCRKQRWCARKKIMLNR